jgi:lactate permease
MTPLPLDVFHWVMALAPIAVLLILLVGLHWKGIEAGPAGMITAGLIVLLVFRTPFRTLAVAGGKGI